MLHTIKHLPFRLNYCIPRTSSPCIFFEFYILQFFAEVLYTILAQLSFYR